LYHVAVQHRTLRYHLPGSLLIRSARGTGGVHAQDWWGTPTRAQQEAKDHDPMRSILVAIDRKWILPVAMSANDLDSSDCCHAFGDADLQFHPKSLH
jgi:hypothetical protein